MALASKGTFGYDLAFLQEYDSVIVLSNPAQQAQIIVSPRLQGRVMTSTSQGSDGKSYGWVNYELIASRAFQPHINAFGGEDRFWLGPEGGQFSIFFKKGDPFDLTHWQTPVAVDTESFQVISHSPDRVQLRKDMEVQNYSGASFQLRVNRSVRLLSEIDISKLLAYSLTDSIKAVGFESDNRITNIGTQAWEPSSGLVSVWILGMFRPSPATTIIIPIKEGSEQELGPPVNDRYFGKVPDDRLDVQGKVLYFKGDGQQRGKIGVPFNRAKPMLGSYDAQQGILTIVQFNLPETPSTYVNSLWEIQKDPFSGDVINSYNDGPAEPGAKPMGPFYELETSSPAAALAPGRSLSHVHRTFHFEGPMEELDKLCQATLGVPLQEVVKALL
ncbi:hypothetical protein GXP67_07835 [Rhodocytophaga rosea]|uniref:Uncharacterized protein n=1 Tax=Rhodocytophaga rosea TaxID=2704465 RepID=A0A6C0GUM5_9BACT|nr:hypothetical protein GXP67_07835 [Rhodocytophaga rosea]